MNARPLPTLPRLLLLPLAWAALTAIATPTAQAQQPSLPAGGGGSSSLSTPYVQAELLAQAPQGLSPGATVWLGLKITHQPEWHTYWKNAGDSGLPTELRWTLPPGLVAGEVDWPTPSKFPIGQLANYGYENTVLLPVPVQVTPEFRPPVALVGAATVPIELHASWLVCRKECIPEEGRFSLKLPAQGSTAAHGAEFEAALAARPKALASGATVTAQATHLGVRAEGLPAAAHGKTLGFYPETGEVIRNGAVAGKDWTQRWDGGVWTASLPLSAQRSASPSMMPIVLALEGEDRRAAARAGQSVAWRLEAPVQGSWSAVAAPAAVSPALQAALEANKAAAGAAPPASPAPAPGLLAALIGALLGGLLLNLMPCVFPVLAVKVLGFTRQAGHAGAHRRAALAYTAGVLLSFLALGCLMLALRAAGAQLGWGFQLQSPAMVAALAVLFTLLGLNLAGLFEVGMLAPSALSQRQLRHPVANDFLSGVLAVLVASPCTAPFMGASLGLAISLPAVQALLLFGALGLGLALPYLLAGFVPAVARLLPRPGSWMDTLRRLLAFPMFATVAWLIWVLGQQSGIDGAAALLMLLVAGSAVVWALSLRGRARLALGGALAAMLAGLVLLLGPAVLREAPAGSAAAASQSMAGDARWQPWSEARVAALQAEGRPVFVDFTAAWCVTCQVNKHGALSDAQVLADFDAARVQLLRADWTRRDPAITAALAALGRSGVPVYVLLAPGQPPQVFSELLSARELRAALARIS
ncbi:protein-disulfide reductase DsbD family protein [Xenophilus arseniciresistens]|uniref:Protein-disulfide reductase DsbD family protein n=1 Tax=Xenophilus arseniciresistens TaxID=1283306 RepID=A0AAE3T167_9BURK|nr:thioredoxin family protein [Xenophilus arseniciresistens]MDA7417052.1 protein-disulfide reductase DsbD family protein [Xenophilus arseniciresistens]